MNTLDLWVFFTTRSCLCMLYTVPLLPDVVLTTWMQPCVVVVTTGAWRSRASSLRRQAVSTAHPRLAFRAVEIHRPLFPLGRITLHNAFAYRRKDQQSVALHCPSCWDWRARDCIMDIAHASTSPESSAQGIDQPLRKKQKRNKPTLSCEECVERKTKVRACSEWMHHGDMLRRNVRQPQECHAESARSATAADRIVWHVSSDSRHANTRTLPI
jgi:hypothetical protein